MGEVVVFGKELVLFMELFKKAKEKYLSDAYDWAVDRQNECEFLAQPIHMTFPEGDYVDNGDGFTISLFYKEKTGEALLRRDWEEKRAVQYNILTNYREVAEIAPRSLELMLRNGLKVKQRWEEAHC